MQSMVAIYVVFLICWVARSPKILQLGNNCKHIKCVEHPFGSHHLAVKIHRKLSSSLTIGLFYSFLCAILQKLLHIFNICNRLEPGGANNSSQIEVWILFTGAAANWSFHACHFCPWVKWRAIVSLTTRFVEPMPMSWRHSAMCTCKNHYPVL